MNDEKIWLRTKEGQEFFIYKTEKCDMQKELTETINNLQQRIDKAIEYIRNSYNLNWYVESNYKNKLLEILKGENND